MSATFAQSLGRVDEAVQSYEQALRHDTWSVPALTGIADILRDRDQFQLAIDYLRTALKVEQGNGEIWSHLGKGSAAQ